MRRAPHRLLAAFSLLVLLLSASVGQAAPRYVSSPEPVVETGPPGGWGETAQLAAAEAAEAPAPAGLMPAPKQPIAEPTVVTADEPVPAPAPAAPAAPIRKVAPGVPGPTAQLAGLSSVSLPAAAPTSTVKEYQPLAEPAGVTATNDAGYLLTLSRELFAYNEQADIVATLTQNGVAVAGASVRMGGGTSATTGADGKATLPFTAPSYTCTFSVSVSTQTFSGTLAEIFVLSDTEGVLIIDQIGGPGGTVPTYAYATFISAEGTWSNSLRDGRLAMIVPAGAGNVEVGGYSPGGDFFIYQPVTISPRAKANIHPSAASAVALTVTPSLDGTPLHGTVALHSEGSVQATGEWLSFPAHQALWVTPGTYSIAFASNSVEESVLLTRSGVNVTAQMGLPINVNRAQLGKIILNTTDGKGQAADLAELQLQAGAVSVSASAGTKSLLAEPGSAWRLHRYMLQMTANSVTWHYRFYGNDQVSPVSVTAGSQTTVNLGGPVTDLLRIGGNAEPGNSIQVTTGLRTARGDQLDLYYEIQGQAWRRANGIVTVTGPGGTELARYSVGTDWGDRFVQLPGDASGVYTARVSYPDLGPYQAAYVAEANVSVAQPEHWTLSLSADTATETQGVNVVATVRMNGTPTAGAKVEYDRAGQRYSLTTDAQGQVTFYWAAGDYAWDTPVWVTPAGGERMSLGYLYVVPKGYGVLTVHATDRSGAPTWFGAVTSWYDPQGGWDIRPTGSDNNGVMGVVRPVGQNYVEARSCGEGGCLFLWSPVTITDGGRVDLLLNGGATVRVETQASVDGTSFDHEVYLHNRQMNGPSWIYPSGAIPGPAFYATPGTYDIAVRGTAAKIGQVLLYQTNLNVAGAEPVQLSFTAAASGLARLVPQPTNGRGQPANFESWLEGPGFVMEMGGSAIAVTPGYKYGWKSYQMRPPVDPAGNTWEFQFDSYAPGSLVAAGETRTLPQGGTATLQLRTGNTSTQRMPGDLVGVAIELKTPDGHELRVRRFPEPALAHLSLKDAAGNEHWQGDRQTFEWADVPMPQQGGTYTLTATLDLGPYQDPVTATRSFEVAHRLELAVDRRVVPASGTTTDVTVTATRAGQPVSGIPVYLGWYPAVTTGADGTAVFHVQGTYSSVMGVMAHDSQLGRPSTTNVFLVAPGDAAVEVSGNDRNGRMIEWFYAEASVEDAMGINGYSSYSDLPPAALIVRAGTAFVHLIKDGNEAYAMGAMVPLAAGQLNQVHFDGRTAMPVDFRAEFDGVPLSQGKVALGDTRSPFLAGVRGVDLSGSGTGTAYVTPGTYAVMVQATVGENETLAASFGTYNLSAPGLRVLSAATAQMGRMQVRPYLGSADVQGNFSINSERFEIFADAPETIIATPGAYQPWSFRAPLKQSNGENWYHEFYTDGQMTVKLQAGQVLPLNWNLAVASAYVKVPTTFRAGQMLLWSFRLMTADGWRVGAVRRGAEYGPEAAPSSYTIRDAAGTAVYSKTNASASTQSWMVPSTPSTRYAIEMSRNLGLLGSFSHTATTTLESLVAPPTLVADQEVLPVGRTTAVRLTLSQQHLPLTNAVILVIGETLSAYRTDVRGAVTVKVRPNRAGVWEFRTIPEGGGKSVSTYAYALTPEHAAVGVKAVDRMGRPMISAQFQATQAGAPSANGWTMGANNRKMVVKAGTTSVIYRGVDASGENYYLTFPVTASGMASSTVGLLAMGAVPATIDVRNADPNGTATLYLRNVDETYTERTSLGAPLANGTNRIWLWPGQYEAALKVTGTGDERILLAGTLPLPGADSLVFDAATGLTQVSVEGRSATEAAGTQLSVRLMAGMIGLTSETGASRPLYLTPGRYQVEGGRFSIADEAANERWQYEFSGLADYEFRADQENSVVLGGPLQGRVMPVANLVSPMGSVIVRALPVDASGLELRTVGVYDLTSGLFLGSPIMGLQITGPGYENLIEFPLGYKVVWEAPTQPGTYTMHLLSELGPYGPVQPVDASVTVRKLARPGR